MGLLAPRADLSAALVFDAAGVQLQRSQVHARYLQASAYGDDRTGKLDLSWKVALSNISALAPAADR